MKPVAIIGAGITGLTAAFRLREHNVPCTVYEASGQVGGVIQTYREDGYLAEGGPNAISEISPAVSSLVTDAGLARYQVYTSPAAEANYLLHRGKLTVAPSSVPKFLATPLFSLPGKLRVCMEPFIGPNRSQEEETLAQFVARRLGPEFVDAVIDPLVAGIYAGDVEMLSARHGFPKLHAAEQLHGSLFRARVFGTRSRKRSGAAPKMEERKFSFDNGLQVLPERLKERLRGAVQLNTPVEAIQCTGHEWSVHVPGQMPRRHSAVLMAVPAHRLSSIAFHAYDEPATAFASLGEIVHPPVACVVLGYKRADVGHPLNGFGFLVPAAEKRRILGAIFSSSVFPGRAPAGHVLVTAFVGGCRNPGLACAEPGQIIATADAELRDILGITGELTFERCTVVPQAIPQYNVGYSRYKETMDKMESFFPGLFFAGTCKDGISLGHSIVSGHEVARRIRARVIRLPEATAA